MTALPCTSGGSAIELSATGAWRMAAAGDELDMVVRRTNSESFNPGHWAARPRARRRRRRSLRAAQGLPLRETLVRRRIRVSRHCENGTLRRKMEISIARADLF